MISTAVAAGPDRLQVARDLMQALGEVTRSGQYPVMSRVLYIFRQEMLRPDLALETQELAGVMARLTELEHEAARAAPDPASFNRRAQVVVDALSGA